MLYTFQTCIYDLENNDHINSSDENRLLVQENALLPVKYSAQREFTTALLGSSMVLWRTEKGVLMLKAGVVQQVYLCVVCGPGQGQSDVQWMPYRVHLDGSESVFGLL